ncbi:MAG: hypothetical protein HRU09_18065 [Oligoflexales bacterium]|nr:hypothetical protein [Oligoflexales bacterium]
MTEEKQAEGKKTSLAEKQAEKRAYYLEFAKDLAKKNASSFSEIGYSVHWIYEQHNQKQKQA